MDARHEGSVGSALWLPLFDELSDPMVVARLAAEAEEAGWHGVFVWDHLRWQAPVRRVADPWITLAAIAVATERVRLGPMITPLPRRRPAKVAKETATLDRLSSGRLVLGAGIGGDHFGRELSATGEQLDDRLRTSSPRSLPRSPICASTRRRTTTSPWDSTSASTRCPM